jgi:hypothetical protein
MVPVRPVDFPIEATEKLTIPFPVPLAPAVRVIHEALLVAVQAQALADAVTSALPLAAAAPTEMLTAGNVKVHTGAVTVIDTLVVAVV